ncbi:hypothetical protein FRB99_005174 [Tulasnella sp. 403]|nr:hypothetical protein FRB99_005174 [Tulasnella sp. 403]
MDSTFSEVFTATSAYSLGATVAILVAALIAAKVALPRTASKTDKITFVWLTFDALIHFILEGSFLYLSTFGKTVATSSGPFASLWSEYAKADIRWVFIPIWLMVDSYGHIATALRLGARKTKQK